MDRFTVLLSSHAQLYCKKTGRKTSELLKDCFEHLEENPFHHPGGRIKKLAGQHHLYRFRIGDLRVIYEINELKRDVIVHLISPRGDAYKKI